MLIKKRHYTSKFFTFLFLSFFLLHQPVMLHFHRVKKEKKKRIKKKACFINNSKTDFF